MKEEEGKSGRGKEKGRRIKNNKLRGEGRREGRERREREVETQRAWGLVRLRGQSHSTEETERLGRQRE